MGVQRCSVSRRIVVGAVYLHGELAPVQEVLRALAVVSAPVEVELGEVVVLGQVAAADQHRLIGDVYLRSNKSTDGAVSCHDGRRGINGRGGVVS